PGSIVRSSIGGCRPPDITEGSLVTGTGFKSRPGRQLSIERNLILTSIDWEVHVSHILLKKVIGQRRLIWQKLRRR
ncbi:MAG: hypothetical protein ACE5KD_02815, partial [Candidatus Bathyarchaeia archaeon]